MELQQFLRKTVNDLPEGLENTLEKLFVHKQCSKGSFLTEPGNHSKKVIFIEKGLCRIFYHKDGKDITHQFFAENSFYLAIDPIFYDRPSLFGIEFLEKSEIRVAQYPEIEHYFEKYHELERVVRHLLIDVLKESSDRLYSLQFQSAKDRYQSMLDQYPQILLRAPLGHIASYLGITQQTLSVIRSQK